MSTILIIEDDEANSQLMEAVVQALGYDAIRTKTASNGLELAETHRPALILLDMRLPGKMSGWEFAETINENPELSNIPLIAVSVQIEAMDERRALEFGCDAYISKPFSINHLRDRIASFLA